jgi:hypothetical protein
LHKGRYAGSILKLPGEGNKSFLAGEYGSYAAALPR